MISKWLDGSRFLSLKWLDEVENEVEMAASEAANPGRLAKRPSTLKTSSYASFDCSARFLSFSYCLIYWSTGDTSPIQTLPTLNVLFKIDFQHENTDWLTPNLVLILTSPSITTFLIFDLCFFFFKFITVIDDWKSVNRYRRLVTKAEMEMCFRNWCFFFERRYLWQTLSLTTASICYKVRNLPFR